MTPCFKRLAAAADRRRVEEGATNGALGLLVVGGQGTAITSTRAANGGASGTLELVVEKGAHLAEAKGRHRVVVDMLTNAGATARYAPTHHVVVLIVVACAAAVTRRRR